MPGGLVEQADKTRIQARKDEKVERRCWVIVIVGNCVQCGTSKVFRGQRKNIFESALQEEERTRLSNSCNGEIRRLRRGQLRVKLDVNLEDGDEDSR